MHPVRLTLVQCTCRQCRRCHCCYVGDGMSVLLFLRALSRPVAGLRATILDPMFITADGRWTRMSNAAVIAASIRRQRRSLVEWYVSDQLQHFPKEDRHVFRLLLARDPDQCCRNMAAQIGRITRLADVSAHATAPVTRGA